MKIRRGNDDVAKKIRKEQKKKRERRLRLDEVSLGKMTTDEFHTPWRKGAYTLRTLRALVMF